MRYSVAFFQIWYDFISGDEWTIAAFIAVAVGAAFWLVHSRVQAWWLLPLAAIVTF
jgi:hypothetical protein